TDLIMTGVYDLRSRSVIATSSPAMDILKSSNIERILYDMFGAERTKELMLQLDNERHYSLTPDELEQPRAVFCADYATDEEVRITIRETFEQGYLMDPHTATCFKAHETCRDKPLKSIVYSTAEWTKFSPTIANALTGEVDTHDIDALKSISEIAKTPIPSLIRELFDKPVAQGSVIDKENIEQEILSFI
ncbi:MAG: hypothetical protein R3179_10915, partial [Sedimenticolaceae bacterium]|nr:hypothetical protein [Sedimenticolaceae bacterium]